MTGLAAGSTRSRMTRCRSGDTGSATLCRASAVTRTLSTFPLKSRNSIWDGDVGTCATLMFFAQRRKPMKHARKTALAASAFTCAALLSFGWSEQGGISLSVEIAQARGGRPLAPMSGAGVARRHNRRAVSGARVASARAAAVGTAAAIGTAGAVAATSPNWGWGGNPYQTGTGYYAGGPYYGGSVQGGRAAYYGGYPSAAWGGVSSGDRDLYFRNLHDSGYDKKGDFNANGTIRTQ